MGCGRKIGSSIHRLVAGFVMEGPVTKAVTSEKKEAKWGEGRTGSADAQPPRTHPPASDIDCAPREDESICCVPRLSMT